MAVIRPELPQLAFTMIPNAWVRDPRLDPNAFRILSVILSHSAGYRLSVAQIMRETGIGRDGVNAAYDRLLALGYFVAVEQTRAERGRFAENDYTITSITDRAPSPPAHPEGSAPNVGIAPQRSGTASVADRSGPAPLVRRTTTTEDQETLSGMGMPAGGQLRLVDGADLFDAFWSSYPKKVGKDAARRAWAKAARRADPDKIIDVVGRYPFRADRQFVKDPATWLNAGCWEDDLEAVAAANRGSSVARRSYGAQHQPYQDPPPSTPNAFPERF
jgi:hypothetical protein